MDGTTVFGEIGKMQNFFEIQRTENCGEPFLMDTVYRIRIIPRKIFFSSLPVISAILFSTMPVNTKPSFLIK